MKLLTREASKGEKKSKKKRGRKRKRIGHGGGDSPSSSDSDGSRRSSPDREESESSSTELLAPLQKRSSKKPGAVLKMLVHHAKTTLDQSSVVGTEKDQQVTGGIKISTYFNLLVRPYHSPASKDIKEMNHLAVCLDELRSGQLGRLGDSLSSRFDPHRGQRGAMAECPVLGAAPPGGAGGSDVAAVGSETPRAAPCAEESGEGVLASEGRRGPMEEQRKRRRWQLP